MEKRRINKLLFVSTKITGGGAERALCVFASTLAEMGYEIHLVLYERRTDEYPLSEKVIIHMLPKRKTGQNKILYYLEKFASFRKIIKAEKPDVLLPFLPYQVEQTYYASRGLDIPMVVTVRNNPVCDTPNEKMRKRRDKIARHVEGVFLQTESQRGYFDNIAPEKCFVVHNPISQAIIDMEAMPRTKYSRIVTLGRLDEQKNFSMLIDAFAIARKVIPEITLDIYGQGALKEELQKKIQGLNLDDVVHLCGRTNDVPNTLSNYDIFVMSSNYEGMPNALMEAMGAGLLCISTDCPTGPKELIGNNECGYLVNINDPNMLAESIITAVNSAEDSTDKTLKAVQKIRNSFSPEATCELLIHELEIVLAKKK